MNHAERNTQLATAIIEACRIHGVGHAFLSPGSRNTALMLALEKSSIETSLIVDERTASFAALGWIRTTGRPAALVCTSGSAPLHYGPAVAEADAASLPLLILSADRPERLRHRGSMQTSLQSNLWPELLRSTLDLDIAENSEKRFQRIDRALAALSGDWPGPVHLNIQFDEPLWCPTLAEGSADWPGSASEPLTESPSQRIPESFFHGAARGLITVGPPFNGRPSHGEAVLKVIGELSKALGWPVLAEYHSGIRRDKAGFLGYPDLTAKALEAEGHLEPDRVLHVGLFPTSKNIQRLLHKAGMVLHLDPRPGNRLPIDSELQTFRGDVLSSLKMIAVESSASSPWARRWIDADLRIADTLKRLPTASLFEGRVAKELLDTLQGEPLCVANSMPIRSVDVWAGYQAPQQVTYVARGVSGIDGTIAGAIGVALASKQPVWVFLGDLALLHDISGLAFARELGVSLRVVVCDNRGGGIFRRLPIAQHATAFESHFLTPQESVNFVKIAEGFGATTARVERPESLPQAFEQARETLGVAVVVVKTESEFDVAEEARIRQACREALR